MVVSPFPFPGIALLLDHDPEEDVDEALLLAPPHLRVELWLVEGDGHDVEQTLRVEGQ